MEAYINIIRSSYSEILTRVGVGMLIVFCLGTIILLALLGRKKGAKWSAGLLLLEYLILLLILAVWARSIQTERAFDFIPFWSYRTVRRGGHNLLLTQIIMNVIAFIPIGFLLGISFTNIKWWKVLLIGGAVSLLVETLQFFLRRGFAEFDDVFHNVLGCMIGYGAYVGIASLVKRMRKRRVVDMQ